MFPTIVPHDELADLDRARIRDAPLFKAQSFSTKHHKLSTRRKRRRTRVSRGNLERDFQWLTLDHRDREIVLREKVRSVLVDCKMRNVAFKLRVEILFPQESRQLFGNVALPKRDNLRLPFQVLFGCVRSSILTTRKGKLLRRLDHFAQPLLGRTRLSEYVCKPISRLGFFFNEPRK